jgi:RimJ/RimL family protein N-acetyltransferase
MSEAVTVGPYRPIDAMHILGPREEYPEWVFNRGKYGPAFTYFSGDRPIACAGIMRYGGHCGEVWLVPGELWRRYAKTAVPLGRRLLDLWQRHYRLARLQAVVAADDETAIRFVEHYGFQREGLLRAFADDGSDMLMYARIRREHGKSV